MGELVPRDKGELERSDHAARVPIVQLITGAAGKADLQPLAGLGSSLATLRLEGDLLRVIGPDTVIGKLKSGELEYVNAATRGLRPMAVDPSSKEIVAHLEVVKSNVSRGAAALSVFQAASFVTGQYYLQTITEQLGDIQHSIDSLTAYLEMGADAELDAASATLDELARVLASAGRFEDQDWGRLNGAEERASTRYFHSLRSCQTVADEWNDVADRLADALLRRGSAKPARVKQLKADMAELGQEVDRLGGDLDRIVRSTKLLVRARVLRATAEVASDAGRGEAFRRELKRLFAERGQELGTLSTALLALNGPTAEEVSPLFAFHSKPARGLDAYRERLVPLAEELGTIPDVLDELATTKLMILDASGETRVPPLALEA